MYVALKFVIPLGNIQGAQYFNAENTLIKLCAGNNQFTDKQQMHMLHII